MKHIQNIQKSLQICSIMFFAMFVVLFANTLSYAEPQDDYNAYKEELAELKEDENRSQFRHNWLNLADKFYELYEFNRDWANRPAALFRAAECYDELARRSYANIDRDEALRLYDKVLEEFPNSVLADDALYYSALFYETQMRDVEEAQERLNLIVSHYSTADHGRLARDYLTEMEENLTASLNIAVDDFLNGEYQRSSGILYEGLRAYDHDDYIQIEVEVNTSERESSDVTWTLDYIPPQEATNSPPRLVLTLNNTRTSPEVMPGYRYNQMGIFSRFVIDYSKRNATIVMMDFEDLAEYHAYYDRESSQIIIQTSAEDNVLTRSTETDNTHSPHVLPSDLLPRDFALQMGLEVRTIIIDPGHGGRDPGAEHNGIVEKDFVLDFSFLLGEELEDMGYNVEYTRTTDEFLYLRDRTAIAVQKEGDLFISVHLNAAESPNLGGLETYYLDFSRSSETQHIVDRENGDESHSLGNIGNIVDDLVLSALMFESQRLAADVQTHMYGLVSRTGFNATNGGTKGSLFTVLAESSMPGIVLELGYISNALDARNLGSDTFVETLAEGIALGIDEYADELHLASN